MLLAALLDAGASLSAVQSGLLGLGVDLSVSQVRRHGFRASYVSVRASEAPVERRLPDIVVLLDPLPSSVRGFARATFERLAAAEARVHGIAVDEVHFHEVG